MTPESRAVLSDELVRAAAGAAPITASSRTGDIPVSWDERTVLTMLDYVRDTVQVKCAGLTDEQARRAPLPGSPLTTSCMPAILPARRCARHGQRPAWPRRPARPLAGLK